MRAISGLRSAGADQQAAAGVGGRGVPGQHEGGGVHLDDDRGTGHHVAGPQLQPVVEARRRRSRRRRRSGCRRCGRPPASPSPGSSRIGATCGRGPVTVARALTNSCSARQGKEKSRSCSASKRRASRPARPARRERRVEGDRELVALPDEAHVGGVGGDLRGPPVRPARPAAGRPASASSAKIVAQLADVQVGQACAAPCGRTRRAAEVVASPSAHSTPGDGGTITGQAPVSRPSALACSGPAPPNATSAKSRGSKPCCTLTSRSPPSMFSLTMSTMPAAAASALGRPIASAIGLHGGAGGVPVEGDLAAGQGGRQIAEHHVGVGHRRLGAALAVRGRARARHRPTAARPAAPW